MLAGVLPHGEVGAWVGAGSFQRARPLAPGSQRSMGAELFVQARLL